MPSKKGDKCGSETNGLTRRKVRGLGPERRTLELGHACLGSVNGLLQPQARCGCGWDSAIHSKSRCGCSKAHEVDAAEDPVEKG
jgi:hypothetical protein